MDWDVPTRRRTGALRSALSFWIMVLVLSSLVLIWQFASAVMYVSYWPAQVVTTSYTD